MIVKVEASDTGVQTNRIGLVEAEDISPNLKIADKFHHHVQSAPAYTWTVNHDFGREPNMFVRGGDGKGIIITPVHNYIDGICNSSTITFLTEKSGDVICV